MSGTVSHIEPVADISSEAAEQRSAPAVQQRAASDAISLAAALQEQEWSVALCDKHELDHYSFLDSLPGMACQMRLDKHGALHFPYVSEGCLDLLGINQLTLQQNPHLLINCLHPADADGFQQSMRLSAAQATPWNWEGRIVLPHSRHDKTSHARPPHSNPLMEQLANRLSPQVGKSLVIPLASEGANASRSEPLVNEIKWVNLRAKHHETNADGTVWKGFMVNITPNKQAEIELEHSRQRLCELSSHIESIKEEERTRIAREIHDEIGVLLTALKMDLAWVAKRLPSGNNALQEKTQDMATLLDTAGKASNNLVHSLRPGSLDCFGIVAAIEIEAGEFTKRTGTPCKIIKSSDDFDASDELSITLFRVFQETLNNIMKHASARHVQVQIMKTGSIDAQIELIVSDDGCGFDETAQNKPRSFGLRGIKERISQLGGEVTITSHPGQGTKIAVRLPIKTNI